MIRDLSNGRIVMAYNVLGSYATARLPEDGDGITVELQDFTLTLLRTALVPTTAESPELARAFLDYLLSDAGRQDIRDDTTLPPIDEAATLAPLRMENISPVDHKTQMNRHHA